MDRLRFGIAVALMSVAGCGSDDVGPQRGPVVLPSPDAGTHGDASTSPPPPPPPPAGVFDWRDAVIYFTFVDRFFDGDGQNPCRVNDNRVADLANYKGGDWSGITKKLQYLQDLGVNTIWLSPLADNALGPDEGVGGDKGKWFTGYHAYWPKVLDPKSPDHCFGSAADLKALVQAAHARNMKVIADYVMVHVHVSSPVYADHKDWFWTKNGAPGDLCNDVGWEVFGNSGSGWFWDDNKPGNKCWFTPMLAHWNLGNQAARKFLVDDAIAWIDEYDLDGLRLDAIKHVHIDWLKELRARITADVLSKKKAGERFYLLGETYDGDKDKLKVHVDPKTMLDGQFDFGLKPVVVDTILGRHGAMSDLANAVQTSETYYGQDVVMSTFVGNHDQPRSIATAGGENDPAAYERLANAFAVLLTVRGAPSILYGDEIGLPGGADPDNRRMMIFDGLSADQTKLRDRVARLAKIRAEHAALRRGVRKTLTADADLWVFEMKIDSAADPANGDVAYVAINRSDTDKSAGGLPGGALQELVTGQDASGPSASVPARQTRIFAPK